MLHQFLNENREALIGRCRVKVSKRSAPLATSLELEHGIPTFLDQLIRTLQVEEQSPRSKSDKTSTSSASGLISGATDPVASPSTSEIGRSATKHGEELMKRGFTVDQVIHDYGDLCQSITELAVERDQLVTVDEFRTLNRCLDNATADAVAEFSRRREQSIADVGARASNERLGSFAHELRNLLTTATLAIAAIKRGNVPVGGATGALLDRSMSAVRALVDRSLVDVRLGAGMPVRRDPIGIATFIEELQAMAALEANARGVTLSVSPIERTRELRGDQQILASAVSNLLSNAIKFTRKGGHVALRTAQVEERLFIEVEDECGGIPASELEGLFQPFAQQQSADRSGIGLGLAISRRGVEANGGNVRARSIAGKGCVFTVDLPLYPVTID